MITALLTTLLVSALGLRLLYPLALAMNTDTAIPVSTTVPPPTP